MGSQKRKIYQLRVLLLSRSYRMHTFCSKVQEYSPSEAAKVYEKTLSSRKNVPMFNPLAALDGGRRRDGTSNDPMANDRQSIQSHFNLATKICNVSFFFQFFFSTLCKI